jgi:hypothetical protein
MITGWGKSTQQPAKPQQAPAQQGGWGAQGGQQQRAAPKPQFQTGVDKNGQPWARLSGGLPGQNTKGGTTVFFRPTSTNGVLSANAESWRPQNSPSSGLRIAAIKGESIKYENGIIKIPVWIQMRVNQTDAQNFYTQIVQGQGAQAQAAPAEEEIPSE